MKRQPGQVRDAILAVMEDSPQGATLSDIHSRVNALVGEVPASSVRSYLRLNTPEQFVRMERAQYALRGFEDFEPQARAAKIDDEQDFAFDRSLLCRCDCMDWLSLRASNSVHAVVTDPPYGMFEYSQEQQKKLRDGKGGVWRIPPSFDGSKRAPLPRFTVLKEADLAALERFFLQWAHRLLPVLVPGANVLVASNPLVSHVVAGALSRGGLERRGELVRLVMTMRGGDRPKHAHEEFSDVSVMPRSMWEPWLIFRKPIEGRVQDNLRKWKTGGFRRISATKPFGDVIVSAPTRSTERKLAPHPSLKPQAFLRQLVRGALPLSEGLILDPFAGSGSTLAAANAMGLASIGLEKDVEYFNVAQRAIPKLSELKLTQSVAR